MAGTALHFPELEPYATWSWILENLAERGLLRNMRGSAFYSAHDHEAGTFDVNYMGVRLGILGISRTIVFEKIA